MNILITNDDGLNSRGLEILVNAFKPYGNIFIVAPVKQKYSASSSMVGEYGLTVHECGTDCYAIDGTPVDCVKYALFGLELNIDLVVSGVNYGLNIGMDSVYSGTVGACMESCFNKIKSIAFSSDFGDYKLARKEIQHVINYIFQHDLLSEHYVLSVNFPKKSYPSSKGIMITTLDLHPFKHTYIKEYDKEYMVKTFLPSYEPEVNSDYFAYQHGYISITPLKLGNNNDEQVEKLRSKFKQEIDE